MSLLRKKKEGWRYSCYGSLTVEVSLWSWQQDSTPLRSQHLYNDRSQHLHSQACVLSFN